MKWTQRDGTKIEVTAMSDSHLVNAVKMLQRYGEAERDRTMALMLTAPECGGDMAQDAFDSAFNEASDATWEDYVPEIYWRMEQELMDRGIDVPVPRFSILGPRELSVLDCKVVQTKAKAGPLYEKRSKAENASFQYDYPEMEEFGFDMDGHGDER